MIGEVAGSGEANRTLRAAGGGSARGGNRNAGDGWMAGAASHQQSRGCD